jgi:hypothetical protein
VRARLAWIIGGLALAGALVYRALGGRKQAPAPAPGPDPRAEELRRKLAESRAVVGERDEFESAETPVDQVEAPAPADVAERRRSVHEEGRAAARRMRAPRADD